MQTRKKILFVSDARVLEVKINQKTTQKRAAISFPKAKIIKFRQQTQIANGGNVFVPSSTTVLCLENFFENVTIIFT